MCERTIWNLCRAVSLPREYQSVRYFVVWRIGHTIQTIYLFIYGLFNDAVRAGYAASNAIMITE
jgi:hypothetical protein